MTNDQHVVPVENRYPPGHDDRETVAGEVLPLIDRFTTTIIAAEVAARTPFTANKCGQILTAIHRTPDGEPFTIRRINQRQAANRYYIDVEVEA